MGLPLGLQLHLLPLLPALFPRVLELSDQAAGRWKVVGMKLNCTNCVPELGTYSSPGSGTKEKWMEFCHLRSTQMSNAYCVRNTCFWVTTSLSPPSLYSLPFLPPSSLFQVEGRVAQPSSRIAFYLSHPRTGARGHPIPV